MKIKTYVTITFLLFSVLLLFGCNGEENQDTSDTSNEEDSSIGGELHAAMNTEPPSLDPHMTTSGDTAILSRNIFEPLVVFDTNFEIQPMLAESWDKSEDNKTYTFYLREGIKFHNDKELIAEDVVASLNRWQEKSDAVKTILGGATFEEEDKYTVVVQLDEPSIFLVNALARVNQFSAIMPKEIIEDATESGVEEYIGTGPFKFIEWKRDEYIHLAKYDDYQLLDEPADGLSGKREALVDDIYFDTVPDGSTRFMGATTGEYDIANDVPKDMFEQAKDTEGINIHEAPGYGSFLVFNRNEEGLFSQKEMRQAINTALDIEKIATAAHGELYELNSNYMLKEQLDWESDVGDEFYNNPDPEKAKEMLKKANYNGEEIKMATSRDYMDLYNAAVEVQSQLKEIGMEVTLVESDWPTHQDVLNDPEKWDLDFTYSSMVTTPLEQIYFNSSWYAGALDEKTEDLLQAIKISSSKEEAAEHWEELLEYSWDEYLPIIKVADMENYSVETDKIDGFTELNGGIYWNVSKEE